LIFQTLDDKQECIGVYVDGKIHYGSIPEGLSATWSYAPYLDGQDIDYAGLFCAESDCGHLCPDALKDRWEDVSEKLKSFLRSFQESKVDLSHNCFFELVPERFLLEYCEIKNKITEHVLKTYERPLNYDFMLQMTKLISKIKSQEIKLDFSSLNEGMSSFKTRQWRKKLESLRPYVDYNLNGTITGRLTTKKNSFPILTLAKEHRKVIKPKNDWFIELDFNAAELRTLLALSGKPQPDEDIHQWNIDNVFRENLTRDEAKKKIFAWLYNPSAKSPASEVYNREAIVESHWNGVRVQTLFNRFIAADKHHALNYIIQSTTSDLFLRRVLEVDKLLNETKSKIAFCIHDSLILDFSDDDRESLPDIIKTFSDTDFGTFKVNVQAGKNFGEMKEMKL